MISASGNTRQELAQIHAKIDNIAMTEAYEKLRILINGLPQEELSLILPELREVIGRFFKKKNKHLTDLVQIRLSGKNSSTDSTVNNESKLSPTAEARLDDYALKLKKLKESHIFQWSTYYRDTVGFVFKDLIDLLESLDSWQETLETVSEQFSEHAHEISNRGVTYSQQNGFSEEVIQYKALSGLQQFLYLLINLYVDHHDKVINAKQAQLARAVTSSLISGILKGYVTTLGWETLNTSYRHWVPALSYINGTDAVNLFQNHNGTHETLIGLFDTLTPALMSIDQLSNMYHGFDFIYPRLSRVDLAEPLRLDITLSIISNKSSTEISISCIFGETISDLVEAEFVAGYRSSAIILRASAIVREWIEQHEADRMIDSSVVIGEAENARDISEVVTALLKKQIDTNTETYQKQAINRNYAKDFPLEDPDFRRLFTVERHSVRQLLEQFDRATGIHLWCSVRRSGKTTAAANLVDMSGRSSVVFQTMDHQTEQPHQNIFEHALTDAISSGKMLPPDFFQRVVEKCSLSGADIAGNKKKSIFVLDEYESLFGILAALANRDQAVKFLVALPLLSQMVGFASKNLLIFMGQRPDAYHILPSQNQLSPLVKQHNFPLFEHHSGGSDSEFSQFLKRVLSQKLPFAPSFIDAIYSETSGHPYLTVNLMVDFCDWLIATRSIDTDTTVDAILFETFAKERLTLAALSRSTFYQFFQRQFSGYLSENSRTEEPWLYTIARVLHQIGKRNPKVLACPISTYNEYASKGATMNKITPSELLSTATMANFLRKTDGHVKPAIRLMARLAACSSAELN